MKLYAANITFHSAGISIIMPSDEASVTGTAELAEYWGTALELLPQLTFKFEKVLIGANALTILYSDDRDNHTAETFIFN